MDKYIEILSEKIMPFANKISGQRHLMAIRKGIVATMPLIIVGSFFTILLNIPIESIAIMLEPYLSILDIPFRFTVGIMSLYATFGIASSLAKSYDLDELSNGILAVMAFIVASVEPTQVTEEVAGVIDAGRYLNIASFSSASLFGGIVAAIVSVEIFRFLKERNITIKMPEGVPPEVSNSFIALIPSTFILLLFWVIRHIIGFDINGFLSTILMPLQGLMAGNSLFGRSEERRVGKVCSERWTDEYSDK